MRSVKELLTNMIGGKSGLGRKLRQYELWDKWEDVVGRQLAAVTKPLRMAGSTIVIGVSNHAWMQELTYLKPELLEKIRATTGKDLINDIRLELNHSGST